MLENKFSITPARIRQTAPLPTASALTERNPRNASSQTGLIGRPPLHALDCVPGSEVFYNTTAVVELLARVRFKTPNTASTPARRLQRTVRSVPGENGVLAASTSRIRGSETEAWWFFLHEVPPSVLVPF